MFGFSTTAIQAAAIGAAALVITGFVTWYTIDQRNRGAEQVKAQNNQAGEDQREERNRNNADIEAINPVDLCRELGGLRCD